MLKFYTIFVQTKVFSSNHGNGSSGFGNHKTGEKNPFFCCCPNQSMSNKQAIMTSKEEEKTKQN